MKIRKLAFGIALVFGAVLAWNSTTKDSNALEEQEPPRAATWEGASFESDAFSVAKINDADTASYSEASDGGSITVSREDGIGFIYVKFDRLPKPWSVTDVVSGQIYNCGQQGRSACVPSWPPHTKPAFLGNPLFRYPPDESANPY